MNYSCFIMCWNLEIIFINNIEILARFFTMTSLGEKERFKRDNSHYAACEKVNIEKNPQKIRQLSNNIKK